MNYTEKEYAEIREQIKPKLKEYADRVLQKSKGNNMYCCPFCPSGRGEHGTGAFAIFAPEGSSAITAWYCHSCRVHGDIFDLIGKIEGINNNSEQLKRAIEIFGTGNSIKRAQPTAKSAEQKEKTDYTTFFLQAHSHINETSYPQQRGLSQDTISRFKLGYVSEWKHPKNPNGQATPRFIIPTSKYGYTARDTRSEMPDAQQDYKKLKAGKAEIFNINEIYTAAQPVYVVEGEIDALSIIEVGGAAVGLGSVSFTGKLIKAIKEKKPVQPLIIALDNDKAGKKASKEIERELTELGIDFYTYNVSGNYKDANEFLCADRAKFTECVKVGAEITGQQYEESKQREAEAYKNKLSAAAYIQEFIERSTSTDTTAIPTGFKNLDEALDGGLYEGLYFIGAISSLGKTTFCLQVLDQMAQAGQDVLIFSLEMARSELMAKSISRHTMQEALETGISPSNAKTTRGITTGKRYAHYNETELELINNAIKRYASYADHIYITEGIGDISTDTIREKVKKHIDITGNKPVVLIDYIQLLAPCNERMTDKQNIDKSVMELKRISRDYKIPIIGISSLNRESYKESSSNKGCITMADYKESGAIEYSSDVLFGLQFKSAGKSEYKADEEKKKNPREIALTILKNRNGSVGNKINFKYYPLFNYFIEE